ncbi:MAG: hypothetical protein IJV03_03750 [Alphaproteobacteria bacterium]|nr:hypothetical protein [Alphaproteobacteria bacterium]
MDVVFKTPIVPIDYNDTATDYGFISADGENTSQSTNYGLTNNNTWAAEYEDGTIVSGRASCQATPTSDNQASLYINDNLEKVQSGEMQFSELKAGVAQLVGNEKANWVEKLFGQYTAGQLTEAQAGVKLAGMFSINEDANYATNSTGQYCYCQMTGYTPNGGTMQGVSAPWVFIRDYGDASYCADDCARNCAFRMSNVSSTYLAFRAALLGSVQPGPTMCDANVININWSNADANDISANNAGTATYGSDVRTPVKAQTIKGKTFKGWRFSKPEQTTTGN